LLLRVAGEGDYEQIAWLAELALRLRQIANHAIAGKSPTGVLAGFNVHGEISEDSESAAPPNSANGAPERCKAKKLANSKSKKATYPKFRRERDELVKIGWSKKEKAEYRHKAPKAVVLAVAEGLQKRGASGERYTFEELLPFRDRDTQMELPSYQAYLVLAWLRKEGLIVQHGRQGYSLPLNINLIDAVEERWKLLPKA
jgi:hypothetical protein